jgi:DNA excision repair protein ERCC-3
LVLEGRKLKEWGVIIFNYLGILRAKRRIEEGFKSRFYTLVASDTDEVSFSSKRRSFLVDQGYEFNVVANFYTWAKDTNNLMYSKPEDQLKMLSKIQEQDEVFIYFKLDCW